MHNKKAVVGAEMTHSMYFTGLQKHQLMLQLIIITYILWSFVFFNAGDKSPKLSYNYTNYNTVLSLQDCIEITWHLLWLLHVQKGPNWTKPVIIDN